MDAKWIAATTFMQRRKRKFLRYSKACDMRKLSDFMQIFMQQTPEEMRQYKKEFQYQGRKLESLLNSMGISDYKQTRLRLRLIIDVGEMEGQWGKAGHLVLWAGERNINTGKKKWWCKGYKYMY